MRLPHAVVVDGAPDFARALDQVDASFKSVPPHLQVAALTALYALFLSWTETVRPEVGAHINASISPVMRKLWRNAYAKEPS